ncbi:hypothetical protein ACR784_14475 [Sphingobacterium multivorum]|uniref:hypothetical protein n=1 Tax=Sphingobacterium multivorum TaxID=28454 RepID=UPI003DA2B948
MKIISITFLPYQMFKLFHKDYRGKLCQIIPDENGIYVVYELYEYIFQYYGEYKDNHIYIEDETVDNNYVNYLENKIEMIVAKRLFEDFFGFLTLKVAGVAISIEVRIRKLLVPELEDILLYLWNQEPLIFNNFFSKSTLKSKLDKNYTELNYSSKFVNIFDDFYNFFRNLTSKFQFLPHYVLRSYGMIKSYDNADITSHSIDWLALNLDELDLNHLHINLENSIKIHNTYGVLEKIYSDEKAKDLNVYENRIILGAFDYVISEINNVKNIIEGNIHHKKEYEREFFSITEFKILPFLKLRDDILKIEGKIKILRSKYKELFHNVKSLNTMPKLTPAFANKRHYSEAYSKIKLIRKVNISLEGEMNLINVKKVSTLYERFNLFVIINSLLDKKPISSDKSNRNHENIFKEYYFVFPNFRVTLFYDCAVSQEINKTGLQRISNGYYKPDYIIRVDRETVSKFYILDSKYSSNSTVRYQHSIKCIKSYILDIGITSNPNCKPEELVLIYPGNDQEVLYGNDLFHPKVSVIPSKVKINNLQEFVKSIFEI